VSGQVLRFFERPIASVRQWAYDVLASRMSPAHLEQMHPLCHRAVLEAGMALGIARGAELERERIGGVYSCSVVRLDTLIERLMFDGRTQPEAAAMAWISAMQTRNAVASEAASIEHRGGTAHVQ
jgi:hypothetical protein